MANLSPGRLTALWHILRTLQKMGGRVETRELLSYASRSSLRSGGLPIRDGYSLAQRGMFVRTVGADTEPSPLGIDALDLCAEDEPNRLVRRLFVSVLVLQDPPNWVGYWQGDPSSLDLVLPLQDREVLLGAGILDPSEGEDFLSKAWWNALRFVPLSEATQAIRKAIGDAGEELSYAFEKRRLRDEGHHDLAARVRWVGRESPAYGFDVASFVGDSLPPRPPETPLAIEVKSVAYPVGDKFPLHLTIHEWLTAQIHLETYVFHLWDGVRPQPLGARRTGPMRMERNALDSHIAGAPPCGENCKWESVFAELSVPIEARRP